MPDSFPFDFAPVAGESPDGWLTAACHHWNLALNDLLGAWSVPQSELTLSPLRLATRGLPVGLVDALASETRVSPAALRRLPVPASEYQSAVQSWQPGQRTTTSRRWLANLTPGSRYCPLCLAETPRWLAVWRVGWFPACAVHNVYLAALCPRCGAVPGTRFLRAAMTAPAPATCTAPAPGAKGKSPRLCGADLREVETVAAPEVVGELATRWDEPARAGAAARDVLTIAAHLEPALFAQKPLDLFASTAPLGGALERALSLLEDLEAPGFAALATQDLRLDQPLSRGRTRGELPSSLRGGSPHLTRALVRARHPQLSPLGQFRWMSATLRVPPTRDEGDALVLAERLPSALWPEWAARLLPRGLRSASMFPSVGVVALMALGSTVPLQRLVELAPAGVSREAKGSVEACLRELTRSEDGNATLRELQNLAAALLVCPPPIDYARRRRLFGEGAQLISEAEWVDLCARPGLEPGRDRRHGHANTILWTVLTGGHPSQALRNGRDSHTGARLMSFIRRINGGVYAGLLAHASRLLTQEGIDDEPLTWCPRFTSSTAVVGIDLCDERERRNVEGALRSSDPLEVAARNVGIDYEHLALVLTAGTFFQDSMVDGTADVATKSQLATELLRDGLRVRDVAKEAGLSRVSVAEIAKAQGLDRPPGRPPTHHLDADWLRVEYIDKGRTFTDLAREAGCSQTAVRLAAQRYGIPPRPRGGGRRAA